MDGIRINKYVSQCGYCSRREADRLLLQGKIYINGNVASMGDRVQAGDAVIIDGKAITPAEKEIIIAFHKPAGIVCTTSKKEKQIKQYRLRFMRQWSRRFLSSIR